MAKRKKNNGKKIGFVALIAAAAVGIYYFFNTDNSNTDNSNTDNSNTDNSNTDNSNTDNSNTDNSNTDNSNTDNSNTDNSNTDNSNTDNSNSDNDSQTVKPEWWKYAHPSVAASALSKEQIKVIFDNILIPFSSSGKYGYITNNKSQYISSSNPVVDIVSVIYIPTGEIITDLDKAFYKELLNTPEPSYTMDKVNGKSYFNVVIRKQ